MSAAAALVLGMLFSLHCEAASTVGVTAGKSISTDPSVPALEETCEADDIDDVDVASFIFAGTELHRSPPTAAASEAGETSTSVKSASTPLEAPPPLPIMEASAASGWQASFAAGVFESKQAVEAADCDVGSWVKDSGLSDAAVPARIVQAEALLLAAEEAPADRWKEKTAERALRIYYHAKWLAERNYARAAEYRYREAARLARLCRRSVLASHALARLGYFLVHWRREEEAAEVLQQSMKLNTKSNPLAPYLHGVLERKNSVGDVDRLRVAEEAILKSGEQPSEELEVERNRLVEEISYWREAEGSAWQCLASSDAAYVLICVCGHASAFLKQVLYK